ncbi:MAG TPA: hypothetical protein VF880_02525 [Actinomycetes bacterium]|jgi:hypothetical protein
MNSNTHSTEWPGGLGLLATAVDQLAAEDLDTLPDAQVAQRVLVLRGLIQELEGVFLRELAGVDGRGAAVAEVGVPVESTAAWLGTRTRMGHPTPTGASGSPARCTAAPWPGPPRRWRLGNSATRTRRC